ncbi:hypothetical protein CRG98_041395 [Punica granatum]|nr:hypothetical protein CRG98_041395 [Punica granatum]
MSSTQVTLLALALLVSVIFLFHVTDAQKVDGSKEAASPVPVIKPIDCGEACAGRCKLSSRPNLCKRACGSCCAKCSCVPPGTAGNYEACPCYASLTTHKFIRKCP